MKRGWLIWVLVLVLAFLLDKQIINFVVDIRTGFLDFIFVLIATYIFQAIIVGLACLMLLFNPNKVKNILVVLISSFVAGLISFFLKPLVMRARPDVALALIKEANFSFPSGHLIVTFACLPKLEKEFPNFRIYFWIFAFIIGFARLYTGVHYLSDLIAGALLGYLVGFLFVKLGEKFKI